MRVTNVIVTAFVTVWLFNGHYHHDVVGVVAAATLEGGEEEAETTARVTMMTTVVNGVGMVAAATLEGGGEETDTTTRGTMVTTVVDGVGMVAAATLEGGEEKSDTTARGTMMTTAVAGLPVATRKLTIKRSKASKPDANEYMLKQLWRSLFLTRAIAERRWRQQTVSTDASLARAENNDDGRGSQEGTQWTSRASFKKYSCNECHSFFESQMQVNTNEQEAFCLENGLKKLWGTVVEDRQELCLEVVQCPLRTSGTPIMCCIATGMCQDQPHYCKLSLESGSYENYWIQTESKADCDTESSAIGCGTCKDKGQSDLILIKAGMPTDGFVSYCRGGPCVWTTQTVRCMGLKYYPDIKSPKDCADACCNDYNCAVWQYDSELNRDQCWYGKGTKHKGYLNNTFCDDHGDITSKAYQWTYGGLRLMGTEQAPGPHETIQARDCVRPGQCAADYGTEYPCCGQGKNVFGVTPQSSYVDYQYQCPKSKPTCVNYVENDHWGTCEYVPHTGQCAANFNSNRPCCDQKGYPVAPQFQCPSSKKTCVNYVYNDHWGTCE